MISKMKKVTLFMSETEVDADLTVLGQLGVMHIKPFHPAEDESIDRVHARIRQMEEAITILGRYDGSSPKKTGTDNGWVNPDKPRSEITLMELVLQTEEKRKKKTELARSLEQDAKWYEQWGQLSLSELKKLREQGLYIRLYLLRDDALKKIAGREDLVVIGKLDQLNQVVLITQDPAEKLEADEVAVPTCPVSRLEESRQETRREIEEADQRLQELHEQIDLLKDALDERFRRYYVRHVQYGGQDVEQRFRYWKGYIPQASVDKFTRTAEEQNWGYLIEDPTQEDLEEVPTLIRSPKWADRIRPVMNFMGLVPGYNEIDVSRVFMIFFTFFTGILVGDAGYGLVFLLLTLLVHARMKFKPKVEFALIYTLSVSILFWGTLTGTWFGISQIAEIPVLSQLVVGKLASFGGDALFTQKFIFILGAVHLSVGHIQTGIKYINSVKAIAQVGWVAIVWGLYLIVNQMVLKEPSSEIMIWLFAGGTLLVALFSNPGTNFFKGMLSSIAGLPLSLISGFSDVISYIRLYAVGLATVLMAVSFNEMAIGDGITTVFAGIGAVIVLILGHGLNMILAAMAVIVHGVRLNMLEYAGHANVEFSGNEYLPFRLKQTNNNNKQLTQS